MVKTGLALLRDSLPYSSVCFRNPCFGKYRSILGVGYRKAHQSPMPRSIKCAMWCFTSSMIFIPNPDYPAFPTDFGFTLIPDAPKSRSYLRKYAGTVSLGPRTMISSTNQNEHERTFNQICAQMPNSRRGSHSETGTEVWSAGSGTAYRLRKAFRRPGRRLWDHGSLVGEIYEVVAKLKVGQGWNTQVDGMVIGCSVVV